MQSGEQENQLTSAPKKQETREKKQTKYGINNMSIPSFLFLSLLLRRLNYCMMMLMLMVVVKDVDVVVWCGCG